MEIISLNDDKIQKRKESQRKGMQAYVERQKDVKHECSICGKFYATLNKSHHMKSKFHINSENLLKIHGVIKN